MDRGILNQDRIIVVLRDSDRQKLVIGGVSVMFSERPQTYSGRLIYEEKHKTTSRFCTGLIHEQATRESQYYVVVLLMGLQAGG